jgi:putative transposase
VLRTAYRAPRMNATCERFLGSVRRECLDHLLLPTAGHLRRARGEYVDYFNHARPHQGIGQAIPEACAPAEQQPPDTGQVVAWPVLGGLHHDYRRVSDKRVLQVARMGEVAATTIRPPRVLALRAG